MSDLIDRQAAIDALETIGYDFSDSGLSEIELEEVCEAVGDVRQDMIRMIKQLPSAQPDRELIEQLRWERDTAIQQLKDLGYGLGEKPRTDDAISRQDAIDVVRKYYGREDYSTESIEDRLKRLPSAQPEIIRCKDCRYASPNGVYGCKLERFSIHDNDERLYSDDFCSCAERRTDG